MTIYCSDVRITEKKAFISLWPLANWTLSAVVIVLLKKLIYLFSKGGIAHGRALALQLQGPGFAPSYPFHMTQLWVSTGLLTSVFWCQILFPPWKWTGHPTASSSCSLECMFLCGNVHYVHLDVGPTFDPLSGSSPSFLMFCVTWCYGTL